MSVTKLSPRRVHKIWGCRDLPEMFGRVAADEDPVGEIWFDHPGNGNVPLLVKYLFTSDRLSIQVHPDDETARAAGYPRGKDEAWLILHAEPGAAIGMGIDRKLSCEELRAAALSGEIEHMLNWRQVSAGDILYSPAGTIHAMSAGLAIIEFQQNMDLTYRLYDYGRARELHLEAAINAALAAPPPPRCRERKQNNDLLVAGGKFVVQKWNGPSAHRIMGSPRYPVWLVPIRGEGEIAGRQLRSGEVWVADELAKIVLDERCEMIAAYPGKRTDRIRAAISGEKLRPKSKGQSVCTGQDKPCGNLYPVQLSTFS